jgi:hypothetical protein
MKKRTIHLLQNRTFLFVANMSYWPGPHNRAGNASAVAENLNGMPDGSPPLKEAEK